jgi:hypothetical protein
MTGTKPFIFQERSSKAKRCVRLGSRYALEFFEEAPQVLVSLSPTLGVDLIQPQRLPFDGG